MDFRFEVESSGKLTIDSDSLVHVKIYNPSRILSSTEPVKFCVNLPAPSGKAKYSRETDSEPVL